MEIFVNYQGFLFLKDSKPDRNHRNIILGFLSFSWNNFYDGVLLTGLPNNTDYSDSSLLKMVKDFQNWKKVRMIGSAAMAAVYVASGKADLYSEK